MKAVRVVNMPQLMACHVEYYIDNGHGEPLHDLMFETWDEAFEYSMHILSKDPTRGEMPIMEHVTPLTGENNEV